MPPSESFLPHFCSLSSTLLLIIASSLLAFILALADFTPTYYGFWSDLGLRAFFIIWITLPAGAVLCILRPQLVQLEPIYAGGIIFLVVQIMTGAVLLVVQSNLFAYYSFPIVKGSYFHFRVLIMSAVVTLAWLRYHYIESRWQIKNRTEALARLEALQARMQPHFLFNTLNAIASLIRKKPAEAEELVLDLSDVLRAVLKNKTTLVSLREEIELTQHYLKIEQQRLGDRLKVVWECDSASLEGQVPFLSLQPLAENAIRHGLEKHSKGGELTVSCQIHKKNMVLSVINPLPDVPLEPDASGNREAIVNLQARLLAHFDNKAYLQSTIVDGLYKVQIVIPYTTRQYESSTR